MRVRITCLIAGANEQQCRDNAVAMNRVSKLYATGLGVEADGIEGTKWNILAKAGGRADAALDEAMAKMKPEDLQQAKARAAAFKPVASGP